MIKILFFSFFIAINSYAISPTVLDESYPGFHDYEAITLNGVRNYFRNFFLKSAIYTDENGTINKIIYNPYSEAITFLVKIERETKENIIVERVIYTSADGKTLAYQLTREGENLWATNDNDLLIFKFRTKDYYKKYKIEFFTFGNEYYREKNGDTETSYLFLKNFNSKVFLDTRVDGNDLYRDYIYSSPLMDIPVKNVSVKVTEDVKSWSTYSFIHTITAKGVVTPKTFFDYLNEATFFFEMTSEFYVSKLLTVGFPNLNPENSSDNPADDDNNFSKK